MTFTVKRSRHCEGLSRSNPVKNEKLKMKNEKYLLSHVILTVGKDPGPKKRYEMLRSSA
ncbi:MAG: hypothetical protein LBR46_00990 [Prevotella sp.]|jgi:hypothetical protein|nr:hypothetical protein [Prevotella sp.]